jgi:hypothetical protein
MPESVTDRPTRSHEYVFLLSKSERYFYDAAAVRTTQRMTSIAREARARNADVPTPPGQTPQGGARMKAHSKQRGHARRHDGFNGRWDAMDRSEQLANGANLRDVWWISPECFKGAHFAVMPSALAELAIRAGTREGDDVLDPFGGAGTTGLVAQRLGRDATLIELSPKYAEMARLRIRADCPLFQDVEIDKAMP